MGSATQNLQILLIHGGQGSFVYQALTGIQDKRHVTKMGGDEPGPVGRCKIIAQSS